MAVVVPYALSVHGFIAKVGSYAGFAAIIGVALVVIMLFVHARETASLRERAEDAEDRVDYLEQTVQQLERQAAHATQIAQAAQAGARPAPAPAAARAASPARTAAAPAVAAAYAGAGRSRTSGPPPQLPAAPLGTAGPALSSATRLIPDAAPAATNGRVNGNGGAVTASPEGPRPSTAAAGAPVPMPQIAAPGRAPETGEDDAAPRLRPDAGVRAPRRDYRANDAAPRRRLLPIIIAVVLVAAIAIAAVVVLGHHAKGHAAAATRTHTSSTGSKATKKGKRRVAVNPRDVTVAVLNGTTTSNFAASISQKLGKLGFKQGKTGNFSSQNLTTTTIGYVPGHRAQALAVAKALTVKYANVKQVTAATQQIVCTAGTPCPDQVFVVLGTDLASGA